MAESSDEDSNGDLLLRTLLEEEGEGPPSLDRSNQQHLQEEERHHHLESIGAAIVTRQLPSLGLSFQLWPAAASLLALLDLDPSRLLLPPSPLRLLELGSGTGLAGIAAAALLRADVTLTDLPHVLPNLRSNAESNAPLVAARGGSLRVRQLRWGSPEDEAALGGAAAFDAVVAADVVYHEHLFEPLLRTVGAFVREGEGTAFLMAHLRRWKKRDALFFRKARKSFRVALVHADPPLPGSRTGVAVYRFTAK
ncbi:uncharacterized protein M6B38_277095 [Iris pallida]|uniref:Uncharacterized protein n=1 Tax=Iris pallida TaxID=29817 RepID=A0AAX6I2J8_IRIPA|nr:uncharacterized protein M6B38_277095 [Iris pallida]